jgi:hypothetical protein
MNSEQNITDAKPVKINLRDYGFEKSGQATGSPNALKAELESIYQGRFVDESIKIGKTEEEKSQIREKIDLLRKEIVDFDKEINNLDFEIKNKEEEIVNYNKEIENFRLNKGNHEGVNSFSQIKFSINLFFLVMLSIYLFLFYVSTVFKVFYFDAASIAKAFADGTGSINALPSPGEMNMALKHNYLLLFAPFIFYAFGYALHIVLENKNKIKYLYATLIISVTFILDFLMAYLIHSNISEAKEMIGLTPEKWSSSSIFYIILFMGFVVYIIWSILLDALLNEWKKRDVITRRLELIKEIKLLIDNLNIRKNEILAKINLNKQEIQKLDLDLQVYKIPVSDIKHCLAQFYAGWIQFLAGSARYKPTTDECESSYKIFLTEKKID